MKYLFCKIFNIEIHEEDESMPMEEHSIKDDMIDVGGGPIEPQPTRLRREMFIKKDDSETESP